VRPAKVSRPGRNGVWGSESAPAPETRTSAVIAPARVSSRHRLVAGSQLARSSAAPNRRCGVTPNSSAQVRRYSRISGWGEKERVHSGLGAKEKEYSRDGTSQAAPG